uniref:(northern house mosquito) hypothetical protein n=1 Tax=Culex pipiens TaxID=7175 RepID=A0A8D8AEP4_CULPI
MDIRDWRFVRVGSWDLLLRVERLDRSRTLRQLGEPPSPGAAWEGCRLLWSGSPSRTGHQWVVEPCPLGPELPPFGRMAWVPLDALIRMSPRALTWTGLIRWRGST